jgi:MSHA biogenesis protein MshL
MTIRLSFILLPLFLWGLSACTQQDHKPSLSREVYDSALDDSRPAPVPDFVNDALLNRSASSSATRATQARRFDVSVNNIPAKAFFLSLVSEAGVNVVTHPDVTGNISLNLRNVTVEETLSVVRDMYGYEFKVKDNIYSIFPRKLRTEIFSINYIDIKRVGVTDTNVSIGEIKSSSSSSSDGGGGGGSSNNAANILGLAGGAEDNSSSSGQGISPGSRVQTLNKTDFWQMVKETVGSMVGVPAEGRNVMVNPQSGLLAVTAMPAEINAVREFLERSELSVKRQVILEAKILEVRLSEGFDAGINWNAIQGQLQYSKNVTSFSNPVDITGVEASGTEVFASIFKVLDIRDLLSLLETQGSVQVLSSPRVSTVNNQKAVIRVGTDEFFVTGLKNNTTSSAATTTSSPEIELTSFFSGISLDVTPQISEDGDVILHIHPIISDVRDQTKEVTVGDSKFSMPLALREIRESDSVVRARSGQVVVLGGLMQKSRQASDGKRPILGDIPVVNLFFKTKSRSSAKTELVILLRPVVVGEESWRDQIKEFREFSGPVN